MNEREVDRLVSELGFELVSLEKAGGRRRPLLRLRIDRPGGEPGVSTVNVDDCARVSRALERHLEESPGVDPRTIVEVSSPGVERPLVREGDYRRFAGHRVSIQGYGPLIGGRRRVEGELLGLAEGEETLVRVEVDGERLSVPFTAIARGHLVHDWESELAGRKA